MKSKLTWLEALLIVLVVAAPAVVILLADGKSKRLDAEASVAAECVRNGGNAADCFKTASGK